MKSVRKAACVAGATAVFMALGLSGKEAEAEPVVSSWYGSELEGSPTASGEPYRPDGHTAAHRSLPLGTKLLVSYGGRQAVVRVNDRGPHVAGRGLDLSRGAAQEIGLTAAGADMVDIQVLDGSRGRGAYHPSVSNPPVSASSTSVRSKERPSEQHAYRKDRDRGDTEGIATFLRERPYMRILGAPARYSETSTKACQEASMTVPTSTAGKRLSSIESTKARVVAAVAPCSQGTRSL